MVTILSGARLTEKKGRQLSTHLKYCSLFLSLLFVHLGMKITYDAILLFAESDSHLIVSDS